MSKYRWILASLGVFLLATAAFAQAIVEKPAADEITVETLQARQKQIEQSQGVDDALKAKVADVFQSARSELESARSWAAKAASSERVIAAAPKDMEQAKDILSRQAAPPAISIPDDMTPQQIDQAIAKQEVDLNVDRNRLTALEAQPNARAARRMELPKDVNRTRYRLSDVEKQLKAAPAADEPPQMAAARRLLLLAHKQNLQCEALAYDREIAEYTATADLLPLQRDLATRRLALAEQRVKQWRTIANQRRQREADSQVQQARMEATVADSGLRKLAQDNAALAEMRKELAEHIADTSGSLERISSRLASLREQFKRVQEKVDAGGLTNAIGLLLRKQRESLPNVRFHSRAIAARQQDMRESQLALLQFEDRRAELANLDAEVKAVLSKLDSPASPSERAARETAVRAMLQTEKEYLDALISDHNSYFDKLVELDDVQRKLIFVSDACGRYIDERVLWIGSAQPLAASDIHHAGDALWWLAQPEGWKELGQTLVADAEHNPGPWLLAALVFAPLVWTRRRLRRRMCEIGEQAVRASCDRFWQTLETASLTLLIAAVVPGAVWFIAWRLSAELDASDWCKSIGGGLGAAAHVYFVMELIRQICHPHGLGGAHFDWNVAGLKSLRTQLRWLMIAVLPLTFLIAAMDGQDNERWRESLGRMSFVVAAICYSLFLLRALRPSGSVFAGVLASLRGGWIDRLRYAWYPLAVCHPLALLVAAALGYYYTSQQLAQRMFLTGYLLVGLIVLRALLLRWSLISRRNLAMQQARQRRTASQTEVKPSGLAGATAPIQPAAPAGRDLATLSGQTRRLIEYSLALAGILGVWFVWVDVMPALRILDQVHVWQTTISVTETAKGPDGIDTLKTVERLSAITLADLGLAALILATTLIAAKNIPGLLEMSVLQHLPLEAGIRYAVATVSRYVITVVGLMLACNTIGLGWAKVQWLLAAISVGLGFGLQEIFANFVSGLIILFERPVRVGDVVTIADVTGTVSQIHMRATTIINGDRKELIIPNKEFITGRVLNWTLSDRVNRVAISVGIAHGSDTELASELLLKVARSNPVVLQDPAPGVTFEEFGDNSLNFVLRCFLPNLENRSRVIHELHMNIDRAFRDAGIDVGLPQQEMDVHVRSIDLSPQVLQAVVADRGSPSLQVTGQDAAEKRPTRNVA